MESDYIYCLASCACCPKVVEDIAEGNVLEEGGFIFQTNNPRFFHVGEDEFLPHALGGLDGRLTIKLAGPCFYWRRLTSFLSLSLMEGS